MHKLFGFFLYFFPCLEKYWSTVNPFLWCSSSYTFSFSSSLGWCRLPSCSSSFRMNASVANQGITTVPVQYVTGVSDDGAYINYFGVWIFCFYLERNIVHISIWPSMSYIYLSILRLSMMQMCILCLTCSSTGKVHTGIFSAHKTTCWKRWTSEWYFSIFFWLCFTADLFLFLVPFIPMLLCLFLLAL